MFILSEEYKRMVNLDQVRSLELQKGKGYYDWNIVAVCDVPGIYFNLMSFNDTRDQSKNKENAEAVFTELCYTIENSEDRNVVIHMDSFGDHSIYNRSK